MRLLNFATSGDLVIGDPYWCFLIDKDFGLFHHAPLRGNSVYVDLDAGLDHFKELAIERMKILESKDCDLVTQDYQGNSNLDSILMDFYWVQETHDNEHGSDKNLVKMVLNHKYTFRMMALLMRNKKSLEGGKKSLANLFGNTIRMLVKHRNVESDVSLTTKDEHGKDIEVVPMDFLRENELIEGDPLIQPGEFNPLVEIMKNLPMLNDERPALRALYEEGNIPWFVLGTLRFDCLADFDEEVDGIKEPRQLQFFVVGRPTQ